MIIKQHNKSGCNTTILYISAATIKCRSKNNVQYTTHFFLCRELLQSRTTIYICLYVILNGVTLFTRLGDFKIHIFGIGHFINFLLVFTLYRWIFTQIDYFVKYIITTNHLSINYKIQYRPVSKQCRSSSLDHPRQQFMIHSI